MTGDLLAEVLNKVRRSVELGAPIQLVAYRVGSKTVTVTLSTFRDDQEEIDNARVWLGALGAVLGASEVVYGYDAGLSGHTHHEAVVGLRIDRERALLTLWPHKGASIWYPIQEDQLERMVDLAPLRCAVACPGGGWDAGVKQLLAERPAAIMDYEWPVAGQDQGRADERS